MKHFVLPQHSYPLRYRRALSVLERAEGDFIRAAEELFEFGYELEHDGQSVQANYVYRRTVDLLESLLEEKNQNLLTPSDISKLAFQHGSQLMNFGRYNLSAGAFRRCVEILEARISDSVSFATIEELAHAHHWLAVSEQHLERIESAHWHFSQAVKHYTQLTRFAGKAEHGGKLHSQLAMSKRGLAKTLARIGFSQHRNTNTQTFEN